MEVSPPYTVGKIAQLSTATPPAAPPAPSSALADREFALEIRKGLLIIMRACMRRFKLTWADFLPNGMAVVEAEQ